VDAVAVGMAGGESLSGSSGETRSLIWGTESCQLARGHQANKCIVQQPQSRASCMILGGERSMSSSRHRSHWKESKIGN